jgi:hypothetical protein
MEAAIDRSPGAASLRSPVAGFGVDVTDVERATAALLARAHGRLRGAVQHAHVQRSAP